MYRTRKSNKTPKPYDFDRLKSYSLWLMGRRDYSLKEMTDKLSGKTEVVSDVEKVVAWLIDYGYLSDERFTEVFVRSSVNSRGHGPQRIRQSLRQKGIDADQANFAIEEAEVDWVEKCRELRIRKFKADPADYKEKQKQMAFLARRGFSMSDINRSFEPAD